jgi:hypothetical protein
MQQSFIPPDQTTISPRQKRLMSILSGLLLGSLEVASILNSLYFRINYLQFGAINWLGIFALLYFVAPIPLGLYVTRQTGNITEGWKAGGMTGCIGALFAIFSAIVYVLIYAVIIRPGSWNNWGTYIIVIFIFLNAIGALISFLGSAIGSALGKISKHIIR